MKKQAWVLLSLILLAAGLPLSCAPQPVEPTVASTESMEPMVTPSKARTPAVVVATRTPVPTASNTATSLPSPTLSPTSTDLPTPTSSPTSTPIPPTTMPPSSTVPPPTDTPAPAFAPVPPEGRQFATLDEFWAGTAEWMLEVYDVGLPVGESDTVHRGGTEFWSYLHASHQSAGVVDRCGDPAPFPGCVTLWKSHDGGTHFSLEDPTCLFPCASCPCGARDHTDQQQYPRVFFDADRAYMVYEWGAATYMRSSADGIHWTPEAHVPSSGLWRFEQRPCTDAEVMGEHPHIYSEREWGDCLLGAPPGIYIEQNTLYVFVGLGRSPGHMGCLLGYKYNGAGGLRKCDNNPLFGAELGYGPIDVLGADANAYFEFRTISSADLVRVGDHYYMVYEGVRGPSNPTVVDNQFALGLARSVGLAIDGAWERFPGNPIIMDLANNWGIGHGDLLIVGPATYLYTATSQETRGRYVLVRR